MQYRTPSIVAALELDARLEKQAYSVKIIVDSEN